MLEIVVARIPRDVSIHGGLLPTREDRVALGAAITARGGRLRRRRGRLGELHGDGCRVFASHDDVAHWFQ
eukprot:2166062-Alexandrium_andersonii.AAC.1